MWLEQCPYNPETPTGAWEFHGNTKIIESSEKKDIRICLYNTENDNGYLSPEESYHNWTMANHRMAGAVPKGGVHLASVDTPIASLTHSVCSGFGCQRLQLPAHVLREGWARRPARGGPDAGRRPGVAVG